LSQFNCFFSKQRDRQLTLFKLKLEVQ